MNPYRVKHIPTGLYFQPHKHRGSHFSKKGKVYLGKTNGLNIGSNKQQETFRVNCEKDSQIHKLTKDTIIWKECGYARNQLRADTLTKDWVIEELKLSDNY